MIDQAKNILIVGIKGVMMTNLAIVLKQMNKYVTGYDVKEEFITDKLLQDKNFTYSVNPRDYNLLNNLDLIIYSAAHGGTSNPLVVEAKKRGIVVKHQVEIISEIMDQYKHKIAVTGCHGKTTTSSLLVYSFQKLGAKPGYLVGTPYFNDIPGGEMGEDDYFIAEADEYGLNPPLNKTPKFNLLNPDYIVCTNIDFDHPDVYKDIEETKKAFINFFGLRKLIVCADDKNLMDIVKQLPKNQYITYGFNVKADVRIIDYIIDDNKTIFKLEISHAELGSASQMNEIPKQVRDDRDQPFNFIISIFGKKNISNSTAVITLLFELGFSYEIVKQAINGFTGAKRRFEFIFSKNNILFYDDYGHHPTEIEATISSARDRFPDKRIVVIFQPHTYSRTLTLKHEFAQVLSKANQSFIMPIFPSAREKIGDFKITSFDIEKIAKANGNNNVIFLNSDKLLIEKLSSFVTYNDVIITMGAGDIYKIKDDIIKIIKSI